MGTYSIAYPDQSSPYGYYALDWDWNVKGEWRRSEKDNPGSPWRYADELNPEAYQQLLRHFGLEQWAEEFPIQLAIRMSPRRLATARRQKEAKYNLPSRTMSSDTIGYHGSAEEHPDSPLLTKKAVGERRER